MALPNLHRDDTQEVRRIQQYRGSNRTRTNVGTCFENRPTAPPRIRSSASPKAAPMSVPIEWPPGPERPEPKSDAIDVWRAELAVDSATLWRLENLLADDERARAARFVFEQDRNRYVAARGILRDVLGRYLQCPPQAIEFVYGVRGKPGVVSGEPRYPLRFNLSHSHGLALIGIGSGREIGIDIERMRPEFAGEEIAKRYFSAKEIAELSRLPEELRTEGFFLCWTRKEAYIKATGDGLHIPLDSFDVSLTPGKPAILSSVDASRWSIESFDPSLISDTSYAAAVVAQGQDWTVRYFEWKQSHEQARLQD